MGLILVPGTRENLEKSIEKSVEISFANKYLPKEFIKEILRASGIEGIRCWAMTKSLSKLFNEIRKGDEVLISEKNTGKFTHYGIIINKISNIEFGNALWPIVGANPWENIYFLANIKKVDLDKASLVTELGYKPNYTVSGPIRVKKSSNSYLSLLSDKYEIPIWDHVAEIDESNNYSADNIPSNGSRRQGQQKFSRIVKTNYRYSCAICGIEEAEFLIGGHISPWANDKENRLNPQNGICFCALHDKAFEHGYLGIDNDFKVVLSPSLNKSSNLYIQLQSFNGTVINLPKFVNDYPDKELLRKHRVKFNLGEYADK